MDLSFDPVKSEMRTILGDQQKEQYNDNFGSIDLKESYQALFELLWYSQLPCFDIRNLTSLVQDEISVIKRCQWKGEQISCASLFSMRPTDRGMCCTFNSGKVDSIFREGKYTAQIQKLEEQDKEHAFEKRDVPEEYRENNEPIPHPGQDKGLRLVLDAHSDLVSPGSVADRFRGFVVLIDGINDYPLSSRRSFLLKPGYESMVQISASQVYGTSGVKKYIKSNRRGCYFPDEHQLKMYKEYSQDNCILECSLEYARNKIASKNDTNSTEGCTPWFYPAPEKHVYNWCDPWEMEEFQDYMTKIPDEECSHCLPDCNSTDYDFFVTSSPFRKCDHTNLGTSETCDFENTYVNPPMWSQQVQNEYSKALGEMPQYIKPDDRKMESQRKYTKYERVENNLILKQAMEAEPTYDAFEKDISVVNFYFGRPTVTQFKRAERLTWNDYIAQIGGLLGLAMGLSLISVVELIYWLIIRLGRNIAAATGSKNKVQQAWEAPRNEPAKEKHEKVVSLMKQKEC